MTLIPLSNREIDSVEREIKQTLPGLYRKLLAEIGHGTMPSGNQIYHPTEISSLYEPFFDDRYALFDPYFPFGCDNNEQTVWVIDAERELAADISHETVPDDWPDETWLEYGVWVINILDMRFGDQ